MLYLPVFLESIQYQVSKTSQFEEGKSNLFLSYAENDQCNIECLFNVISKKVYKIILTQKSNQTTSFWSDESLYKEETSIATKVNLEEILILIKENFNTPKKVTMEIELDDELIIQLAQLANEKGITLDNLIEEILRDFVEKAKNNNLT